MNFTNNEFLMLVAAFLLGYFFQEMMKGCQIVEGTDNAESWFNCKDKDKGTCCKNARAKALDDFNEKWNNMRAKALDDFNEKWNGLQQYWSKNQAGIQLDNCDPEHKEMKSNKKCIDKCKGYFNGTDIYCRGGPSPTQNSGKKIGFFDCEPDI